eukprot:TRINITY_DN50591_c0_g1_i1.p1 TRINITY_DN50591_c0_g1~~TRINITY_DN50591_c0_g1_i1.p1  ORF type:complete len:395 (+),score=128.87 TRINITY_DN50591_c0_g1_i1:115-1185(+)
MPRSQSMPAATNKSAQLRQRVLTTMDKYPGIKNAQAHVAARTMQALEKDKQVEKEYWSKLRKFKSEVQSVFVLPTGPDTRAQVAKEILQKVEKGQQDLRDKDAAYQTWLQSMDERQKERVRENLRQRRQDIEDLQQRKAAANEALQKELEDKASGFKEKEKAYWSWLQDTKQEVASRPGVAPLYKFEGKSVEEMVEIRKKKLALETSERDREYKQWVASVSKPKFSLPESKVNTPAQREHMIRESAKKGLEKMNAATAEYTKWVKEMEQAKAEAMMEKVREKLRADREADEKRRGDMLALEEKMADSKAEQDRIAAAAKQEVVDMYRRVHEKPLLIEQAYNYGKIFKKATALGKTH